MPRARVEAGQTHTENATQTDHRLLLGVAIEIAFHAETTAGRIDLNRRETGARCRGVEHPPVILPRNH